MPPVHLPDQLFVSKVRYVQMAPAWSKDFSGSCDTQTYTTFINIPLQVTFCPQSCPFWHLPRLAIQELPSLQHLPLADLSWVLNWHSQPLSGTQSYAISVRSLWVFSLSAKFQWLQHGWRSLFLQERSESEACDPFTAKLILGNRSPHVQEIVDLTLKIHKVHLKSRRVAQLETAWKPFNRLPQRSRHP